MRGMKAPRLDRWMLACGAALLLLPPAASTQTPPSRTISPGAAAEAARQHPVIVQEFGGEEDAARSAYVRSVAARVTDQSGIAGGANAFRVTTLNSPVLNAFAPPGGYIYITRQMLALLNDEAELALVLGHEAAHIAQRHNAERQRAGILSQLGAILVGVVTGTGELAQFAGQASQVWTLRFSREQEFEADAYGLRYMRAAGYDPAAAASILHSLGSATALERRIQGQTGEVPSWARTHPLSADRVARALQEARASGQQGGVRNRDRFLAQIDGMLVDDDPRQGVIDGGIFRHPLLQLQFTAPPGYSMQNGARAVSIVGQEGQAQFAGGRFSGDLQEYLTSRIRDVVGAQAAVRFTAPSATTVNGFPALHSSARLATQQGAVDLTIIAYDWGNGAAYHFATITRAGSGLGPFTSLARSLRRLSPAEAAAIRPRRIRIVTVSPADSIESLASQMAYTDHQIERFRVLNGLSENASLEPGQKVKLVVFASR